MVSICTSSMIYTRYFDEAGAKLTRSRSSLMLSTLLLEAASISAISVFSPFATDKQLSHSRQGSPFLGFRQLTAFAKILAVDVLPVPRVPVNRYACVTLPAESSFLSVSVICSCPTTSEKVCGRYFR